MKMLIIGMDGVDAETFDRGWTPFIRSLLDRGQPLNLKEDLISRGWSEIVTGRHALDTGALYEGPRLNGTLDWTEDFRIGDVPGLGLQIKPIWQVLNEHGYKVGIMNVPTTYPAPKVDGFFVSGGGGGGPISQDTTPMQCYPHSLSDRLNNMGYILDERRPSLLFEKGLYEPARFFDRLIEMNSKRTEAFDLLAKEFSIDFGFIVYKSSTVTTETMLLAELKKQETGEGLVNIDFIEQAKRFYQELDKKIKYLVENYQNAEILLVSDHSMVLNEYSVNANEFLIDIGYQVKNRTRRRLIDAVKSYKHLVPYAVREKIKRSKQIKNAYQSMVSFNPKLTKAFSQSFSSGQHGIYVNDNKRFGGPVKEEEVDSIAKNIVAKFNAHPIARKHELRAVLRPGSTSAVASRFPDVWLDCPDGYFTNNKFESFLVKTNLPVKALDLHDVKKNERTAVKGHIPLAVNVTGTWNFANQSNLTVIYKHVFDTFECFDG